MDLRFQDQCTVSCTTQRWLVGLGPNFMGVGTSDLGTPPWNFEPRKSIFTLQWASIVRLYLHKAACKDEVEILNCKLPLWGVPIWKNRRHTTESLYQELSKTVGIFQIGQEMAELAPYQVQENNLFIQFIMSFFLSSVALAQSFFNRSEKIQRFWKALDLSFQRYETVYSYRDSL